MYILKPYYERLLSVRPTIALHQSWTAC